MQQKYLELLITELRYKTRILSRILNDLNSQDFSWIHDSLWVQSPLDVLHDVDGRRSEHFLHQFDLPEANAVLTGTSSTQRQSSEMIIKVF